MRQFFGLLPFVLVPYAIGVGGVYLLLLGLWNRFRADNRDLRLLWIPPVFYLLLDTARDRQGLATLHAVAIVTVAVVLALPLKVLLEKRSPGLAIVGIGCAAALLAWLALPKVTLDMRLW